MPTENEVKKALKDVFDPELRMDIVTLGLVYGIELDGKKARIRMTFTSPMCPYGPALVEDVKSRVESLEGVDEAEVEIVFDPPWQPSEELKAALGLG
jgi:metal-sulfur cluster biosynthetic enzyme